MAKAKKTAIEKAVEAEQATEGSTLVHPEGPVTEQAHADEVEMSTFLRKRSRLGKTAGVLVSLAVVFILLAVGFNAVYADKVYPGVTADGAYLGGLSRQGAIAAIQKRQSDYEGQVIPLNYGDNVVSINPATIDTQYDIGAAVDQALHYGRQGSLQQRVIDQLRALLGRPENIAYYSYSDAKLTPYISQMSDDVNQPVTNASFDFSGQTARIHAASHGVRLNQGLFVLAFQDRLATMSNDPIQVPISSLAPTIETDDLKPAKQQAELFLAGPLNLKAQSVELKATPGDIVSWIKVSRTTDTTLQLLNQAIGFDAPSGAVNVGLDEDKLKDYVAGIAKKIDQPGQNAALSIVDGRATVFQPSRDGYALNQEKAVDQIKAALNKSADQRQLALEVKVSKPEVREDDLNDLGINELISEGFSTFPGSSADRLTNVRVGAARYNGVLLKPDEVFSFGALLGDVGPEQGYRPSLVIIGNKEEKQYGGGLCQVSSTAYRAALNAGLPILERTNHAFAVDFYTQPYGVPGVDATIYYPQVDFKFKNDTGHYILIQTIMQGTTLKFDFYGTKTKTGRIRGPQFVSGSLDATQPSHTVFYRDILDLTGNVIKTDTVNTYYKSSKDFTIVDNNQFH